MFQLRGLLGGALSLLVGLAVACPAHPASAASVTYTVSSDVFANPERGFYHHTFDCDAGTFDQATLASYRTSQSISLVMCVFYLRDFKTTAISAAALGHLQQQFDVVRAAGLKMVLRFAYTDSEDGADATKTQVLAHLDQLAPYLRNNSDVIEVMQSGFVGAWGEGYYTQNFGNQGVLTATDWANRKAVNDKILSVLPASRMVQLRTPNFKRTMYGTSAVTSAQAYGGSAVARVGHHNDCFLASPDDYGTYTDTSVEYPYLAADTTYVPMGGETCGANPPRSSCPTATAEMARFHWSYLNTDYEPNVLAGFSSGGCLTDIKRKLGYRFALLNGSYPGTATRRGTLPISFTVRNDGWSAPFNPRRAELVLRNTSTAAVYRLALTADPRRWTAGATTAVSQNLTLPAALPAGSYRLLLNLSDPQLSSRPEYSIRLADQGTWEANTGYNDLLATVTVS
jgi:hypothetical protein